MIDGYLVGCDVTDQEFAQIGKLIWSFTVLEHELARAAMWLRAIVLEKDGLHSELNIRDIASGTLKQRFNLFLDAANAQFSKDELARLGPIEARFLQLDLIRNNIVHGRWTKTGTSTIGFLLFDRGSMRQETIPKIYEIETAEFENLVGEVLSIAVFVASKSGTAA